MEFCWSLNLKYIEFSIFQGFLWTLGCKIKTLLANCPNIYGVLSLLGRQEDESHLLRVLLKYFEISNVYVMTLLIDALYTICQSNVGMLSFWLVCADWLLFFTNVCCFAIFYRCNIPEDNISKGDIVFDYLPVFPARGTGYQRIVFALFKQNDRVDMTHERVPLPW